MSAVRASKSISNDFKNCKNKTVFEKRYPRTKD